MARPVGVTIIAVLYFLGAALCLLGGIGMIAGGGFLATILSQQQGANAGAASFLAGLGAAVGIVFLVFAAVDILLGWGLIALKGWARIIAIVFSAIGALFQLFGLLANLAHFNPSNFVTSLIVLAINAWIIWYLLQPNVNAAFQGGAAKATTA